MDRHVGGTDPSGLRSLQRDVAQCKCCTSLEPWRKFSRSVYGDARTGYLLVGEAPGRVSLENGRRFTGPAGLLIRRALAALQHPRYRDLEDLFYMTDVVKCHPAPLGNPGANRSPKPSEIRSCAPHLSHELSVLRPSLVVTFGVVAAKAVNSALTQSDRDSTGGWKPEVISLPHPSPRNQRTILRSYPSMAAYAKVITDTFGDLIARLESRKAKWKIVNPETLIGEVPLSGPRSAVRSMIRVAHNGERLRGTLHHARTA
jgi:uracil-DNA glycosylase family 4